MNAVERDVVLYSERDIARRVKAVAADIVAGSLRPDIAVPVLTGAYVFAADLLRALAHQGLDLPVEFIWLRSYGPDEAAGDVTVLKAPGEIVRGRTVLLIDGVLDSGATLARAKDLLDEVGVAAIMTAVAVTKPHPHPAAKADFIGFESGPEFLFGYGMDRAGLGRGLPDIRVRRKIS